MVRDTLPVPRKPLASTLSGQRSSTCSSTGTRCTYRVNHIGRATLIGELPTQRASRPRSAGVPETSAETAKDP